VPSTTVLIITFRFLRVAKQDLKKKIQDGCHFHTCEKTGENITTIL